MPLGTTSIDGLISGLDTASLISSLADIRKRPLNVINARIAQRTQDLQAYQALSAKTLALRTSAGGLADGAALQARSVTTSDPAALLATAGAGAAEGTYSICIKHLAAAHAIGSAAVEDSAAALGMAGDFRLNGRTITLQATDSLASVRDKINQAGAGVSASITTVAPDDHRLVLRSLQTGSDHAMDLTDTGAGILRGLGLLDGQTATKHALTSGLASDTFSSSTDTVAAALSLTAAAAGNIRINDVEISVDLAADSLEDIAARITAAVEGVTATVASVSTGDSTGYRLELTGAASPTVVDANGVLETLGVLTQGIADERAAAIDAQIELDGYTITRSTNSLDDVLDGISLDLLQADPDRTLSLKVAANHQAAVTAVQQVIGHYNSIISAINAGQSFDSETNTGGVFLSDARIVLLQGQLHEKALAPLSLPGNASPTALSEIGIGTDRYGTLTLDSAKLLRVLEDDPGMALRLLTGGAEATGEGVEFVSSGSQTVDSGADGYAVNITRAATRATATGNAAAVLAQDETLTINSQYAITLQAGMTLEQAADKLNTIFTGNRLSLTAAVVDGRLQLQSTMYGSNYGFSVSSTLSKQDGVGLGGTEAGQLQSTYGQNVAGTIGGLAAEGWGQWLTGTEGAAKDLKLKITGDTIGDRGCIHTSQGWAGRLEAYAERATDSDNGILTAAGAAVTDNIDALNEDVGRLQESVDAYVERLQRQFAALEGVMAKNKLLLNYMTTQTAGLTKSSVDEQA